MRASLHALPLLLLLACNGDADDKGVDPDDPCAGTYDPQDYALDWTSVRDEDPLGMMMSVWAACQNDVWVVGGQKGGDGFALRGAETTFDAQPLPEGTPMLNWVHGVSTDDLWVAGVDGTLLHWDGSDWQDHSLPEEGAVWGVHARSADDALAVGGAFFSTGEPFAYRWDGTSWTAVPFNVDEVDNRILFKTAAYQDGYLVVGSGGLAMKITKTAATIVSTDAGSQEDMVTIHAANGDAPIAVGGFTGGAAYTYDDAAGWSTATTTPEMIIKLNGVHDQGNGLATAVGNSGSTGVWDIDAGTWTEVAPFTLDLLHATWVAPNGDSYAVGGNFLTSGSAFHGSLGFSPGPKN